MRQNIIDKVSSNVGIHPDDGYKVFRIEMGRYQNLNRYLNFQMLCNFFSIDSLFLVSIFDFYMLQIWFILFIETFPNNAPYFPNNAPCFLMDRGTTSSYQLVCDVVGGDTLTCPHGQLQYFYE